jgi:hypothetical protein
MKLVHNDLDVIIQKTKHHFEISCAYQCFNNLKFTFDIKFVAGMEFTWKKYVE